MISAVIFDFGNVICRFDIGLFLARIARLTSTPMSKLQGFLHHSSDLGQAYETGLITSDEFYRRLMERYDFSLPKEDFIRAYTDIFTPIPTTLDLVRKLKPRYKLGLLSNTNEWHFEYAVKAVEVFPLFDAVTVSFEVKAMKPAEAVYRDMLEKLRAVPEECVYIDDMAENAEAASRIGMYGIHYTTYEDLLRQLSHLHVNP